MRVRGVLPLAAALLVAVGAVGLLAFSSTLNPVDAVLGRGAVVSVPDVEGQPLPRAQREMDEVGLVVARVDAFSLSVPRGSVIRQDPAPGERVRQGERVELVVSRGANRVEMPDAVGRPLDEVAAPLEDAGIAFEVERVADERVPEGIVLSQRPAPGVTVTGDESAYFEVSAGPVDRPVPEVVGRSAEAAAFLLGEAGLVLGEVTYVDHPLVVEGAAVSTDPEVGTVVPRDTTVDLVVSNGGPLVPVPDVTRILQAEAVRRLEAAGFTVMTAGRLVGDDGGGEGSVFEQHPAAGASARPGQIVTIVVGRRPPVGPPTTTTTVPEPTPPPGPGNTTTAPRRPGD